MRKRKNTARPPRKAIGTISLCPAFSTHVNVYDADQQITDMDRTWIGNPHPDFSSNLNHTALFDLRKAIYNAPRLHASSPEPTF